MLAMGIEMFENGDLEFENISEFYRNICIKEKGIIGESKEQNSEIKGLHDKEFGIYKSGVS